MMLSIYLQISAEEDFLRRTVAINYRGHWFCNVLMYFLHFETSSDPGMTNCPSRMVLVRQSMITF